MSRGRTILVNHLLEPPDRITGVTRYLFALLPELLMRQTFKYVLLTTWDTKNLPDAITKSTARILTRRYHRSMPHNVLAQMTMLPHLVHKTGAALEFNCNPVGCFWPAWPRIITIHDLYFNVLSEKYHPRHRLWWHLFFPATLASSSQAVCVSENTRSDLRRFYPHLGLKAAVIHEASALSPNLRPAETLDLQSPYALYVGNISPNKDPDVLVRSLEILESENHFLNVYHVGGDDAGLLSRAVSRSNLHRPVQSIGRLRDTELAAAYERARCLIVSSSHEGFCLPVLEAQSFGTPVICSDISVLREVAGDGALFFGSGDAVGLADCLKSIYNDADVHQRIRLAAQKNAHRFSWTKAAAEFDALFAAFSN
jgi:glycosyltransferase involved in cell wall biosynthesis